MPHAFRIWKGQLYRFIGLEAANGVACSVNHCGDEKLDNSKAANCLLITDCSFCEPEINLPVE